MTSVRRFFASLYESDWYRERANYVTQATEAC